MLFIYAMLASLLLTGLLLPLLRKLKAGQSIREEGPKSHLKKAGTPTMGGIGFILIILLFGLQLNTQYYPVLLLALAYALIGFADDFLKIIRSHNLGLTFWQKIILQTISAGIFAVYMVFTGQYPPGAGFWYFLFLTFIIVGTANATNLTDGLDGLLAGTALIAFLAFALILQELLALISAGALLGYLPWNWPKARVFMGDAGSLALGALLAGIAIMGRQELLLMVVGGVFMLEALSVIIQVFSYKFFKKRVFLMSPWHHHFEQKGFKEIQVVLGFWVLGLGLALLGVWIHGL